MSEENQPSDEDLAKWYLASLRKSIHNDLSGQNVTPATLINMDAGIVEALSQSESAPQQSSAPCGTTQLYHRGLLVVAVSCLLHFLIMALCR